MYSLTAQTNPATLDPKDRMFLKSFLMVHLLGQGLGLNGLSPAASNKQRNRELNKVEAYVDEIIRRAGH